MRIFYLGTIVPEEDLCPHCRGKKISLEKERMEIYVEKGMKDAQKIVLRGRGNQAPGMQPADVIVILQEQSHDTFKRVDNDLYMKKDVSLTEALCGFTFAVTHLDGRVLKIVQPPGVCTKDG